MFLVMALNKEAEISTTGLLALPQREPLMVLLQYADGMVGVMPVFETREQAEAYADDKYQIVEVAERDH